MIKKAEEIIEKLADKTLSFGCMVKIYRETKNEAGEFNGKFVQKFKDYDSVLLDYGEKIGIKGGIDKKEILGHPILIGFVLEKIDKMPLISKKFEEYMYSINNLWGLCGFTKSLQDILRDEVEVEYTDPNGDFNGVTSTEQYKKHLSPKATELFTYLDKIL